MPFYLSVHPSTQHIGAPQCQTLGWHRLSPLGSRRQARNSWVLMGFPRGAKLTLPGVHRAQPGKLHGGGDL